MGWAEAITAASAAVTAITVVLGVTAWRREFVGRRRIELAEAALALFYEAVDAIKEIRSDFSYSSEGTTRKRSEGESEEEARFLDQAYVVFERYQRREKLFAELRSLKYRMMVIFGEPTGEPFDEINGVVNTILITARRLGTHYWPREKKGFTTEAKAEKYYEQREKYENIIWTPLKEDDEIAPRVNRAVEKIEAITKEAVKPHLGFMGKLWQRFK